MSPREAKWPVEVLDDAMAQVLRRMTPAQRLQMVFRSGRRIRAMVEGYLRSAHPDWDEARVQSEVSRRARAGT